MEIASLLYEYSEEVDFGTTNTWDNDTFLSRWFTKTPPNAKGLYWFLTDATFNNIKRPELLPERACDFGETTLNNLEIFSSSQDALTNFLTKQDPNGLSVVYNGQQGNVMNRARAHFALDNKTTAALGIKHYNLSHYKWTLKYFTTNEIDKLKSHNDIIKKMLNHERGRLALENAWRAEYGFPILCMR
jgi:hypothetical protein